jgi:PAS domain S-box-containing protein
VITSDETPRTAETEGSRLEFETLISDLSSSFINLPPGEVDGEIQDALRRVCELLGIDLAVLWQWSTVAPEVIAPTHAHPALEALQPPEPLQQEQFPWLRQQILAGRTVALSSLKEFPEEAVVDREYCRLYDVKSHLSLPLAVGGAAPVGLLGLNTLQVERDWPDALVKRLQLVAQVFANALARKRADEALRESEERLAMAADSAGAGLWSLQLHTGVFWVTERTRAIFGYSSEEVVDVERFMAVVHPDDRDLVREAMEQAGRATEPVVVEYRILPAEGRQRWVSSRGRSHITASGEPDRLMGVSIDITERKRDHEAVRASKARLEAGAELAGLAFYEVDFSADAVYVDDRFRDLSGVPPEREEKLQVLEFWKEHLHPDDRLRVLERRRQLHEGELERFSLEYRYLHPDRGEKWIRHLAGAATRDATGRAIRTYGVLRDVTEHKRAENELHDLSRRLIGAHEEERALLARELHDDVSQRLAVLAIDVGRAELAAPDRAQAGTMREVRTGLVRLSEDIHSLAYQLHPSVLEELGLVEALRAECERRKRQGRLDLALDLAPVPSGVGADAALCLFRIAQEALNNVVRHAGVRTATVTLRQIGDGALLAVSDRGVGFDPESPGRGMSLGLASMRERARLVCGTLDIESAPGRGTTILAWVPAEEAS